MTGLDSTFWPGCDGMVLWTSGAKTHQVSPIGICMNSSSLFRLALSMPCFFHAVLSPGQSQPVCGSFWLVVIKAPRRLSRPRPDPRPRRGRKQPLSRGYSRTIQCRPRHHPLMLEGLGFFWYSISTTPRATKYYGSAPGEARLCCLQRCRLSSGSPRCLAAASPFFNHNFVTRDLPSILNLSISITSLGPFCSRVASIVPSALGPASRRTSLTRACHEGFLRKS